MATQALRSEVVHWKKGSLASLRQLIAALKGAQRDVDKMLGGAKSAVAQVCREAGRIAKAYDRSLDDGDDDYERDSETMDALATVPSADEEVGDVESQISDGFDALISRLEAIKEAVGDVAP